jgi:glucose-1-phosphate adenylyltransferase
MRRVLGIIMAGGRGERLDPLTRDRSKPAVPFGGKYRIVDFVLSNFVNSGILSVYVLVQYKAQSLIEHLRMGWRTGGLSADHFITVVPPQMRIGRDWYRGTADAVAQNLHLIEDFRPDLVAVFGADHVYRMDLNQMIAFHEAKGADVTVAALPVPLEQASAFGIVAAEADTRIVGFEEKPARPAPMPADPTRAYSSMGNYLFDPRVLVETLLADSRRSTEHDFGRTIIPELFPHARVFAYNFLDNRVPGIRASEERGYWRDVGTIEAYWLAHRDLLGRRPSLDLDNDAWPILSSRFHGPVTRIVGGSLEDSLIAEGSRIEGAAVRSSVVGRGVRLEPDVLIEDAILMDFTHVGKGARLRRVIVDRYNRIEAGATLGYDPAADRARGARVDPSGLVVVPRGGRERLGPVGEG